ncbi:ribosomal protein S18-alanine N-acetyltransferase [Neptuniibacter sp. QD72_48]|uniref:ribosomal protein S18-alanine N-acetyltransferase n=1 Tax=unclassified Neptuniibacter TaxID=2630693 RepID=UPI0039F6E40A
MNIDDLQAKDLPAVERIAQSCFAHGAWSAKQYLQQIESERSVALGLYAPDLIGYVMFSQVLDEAELLQIAIDPAHQGCGYAQLLVSQGAQQLQNAGVIRVMLEVRESNLAAIALYDKSGFVTEGVRKNYYPSVQGGQREDAVLMGMSIEPVLCN